MFVAEYFLPFSFCEMFLYLGSKGLEDGWVGENVVCDCEEGGTCCFASCADHDGDFFEEAFLCFFRGGNLVASVDFVHDDGDRFVGYGFSAVLDDFVGLLFDGCHGVEDGECGFSL